MYVALHGGTTMENYEWVRKVPVNKLSNRSLVLVSRFARQLKQITGRVLALTSPDMPINIVKEAQMANDSRLNSLLNNLLDEFFVIAETEGVVVDLLDQSKPEQVRRSTRDPETSATITH